ncbi:MAG: hypothetical protein JWM28_2772 [Chitinophagaceae bacterium]|nr:hypothetical protein [Chitinophagaceae bacterium]
MQVINNKLVRKKTLINYLYDRIRFVQPYRSEMLTFYFHAGCIAINIRRFPNKRNMPPGWFKYATIYL